MVAGVVVGQETEEREGAEHGAFADAVTADTDGQHSRSVGDRHGERDFDERQGKADTAGKQPDGDEVEPPNEVAEGESCDE